MYRATFRVMTTTSSYEFGILGGVSEAERNRLTVALQSMVAAFGLRFGSDVIVHAANTVTQRNHRVPFVAAFFGAEEHVDVALARQVIRANAPVIPTIAKGEAIESHIPHFLQGVQVLSRYEGPNGLDALALSMLECVGLLSRQRRVFLSYRRSDSRRTAMQLHDLLSAHSFDVFLDSHDVRPGEIFQEVLWHRLCDADVMLMLDTPGYFTSKWTRQEFGRAAARRLHSVRLVWPDHEPSRETSLSHTLYLEPEDLLGHDGPITDERASEVITEVERIRGRSIASRYMAITGQVRADVERIGANIETIGPRRAIIVELLNGRKLWAFPVVGIPTAKTMHEIFSVSNDNGNDTAPVLLYDHIGIGENWSAHLKWLDKNIATVRLVKSVEAGWQFAGWEE